MDREYGLLRVSSFQREKIPHNEEMIELLAEPIPPERTTEDTAWLDETETRILNDPVLRQAFIRRDLVSHGNVGEDCPIFYFEGDNSILLSARRRLEVPVSRGSYTTLEELRKRVAERNTDPSYLYLAPHGIGAYQLIKGMKGAAIFNKTVALEMIRENPDLFYVPLVIPEENITTITNPDTWQELNAPKTPVYHQANN